MNNSNWDDLILGLERSLAAAKRLREYYNLKPESIGIPDIPVMPEGLSIKAMMIKIAESYGGKLVVKQAVTIIAANLSTDRDYARNSIYANLHHWKNIFSKISPGVYQIIIGE